MSALLKILVFFFFSWAYVACKHIFYLLIVYKRQVGSYMVQKEKTIKFSVINEHMHCCTVYKKRMHVVLHIKVHIGQQQRELVIKSQKRVMIVMESSSFFPQLLNRCTLQVFRCSPSFLVNR